MPELQAVCSLSSFGQYIKYGCKGNDICTNVACESEVCNVVFMYMCPPHSTFVEYKDGCIHGKRDR